MRLMKWIMAIALCAAMAIDASAVQAKVPGPNGRIAFARFDTALQDTVIYTANSDGSNVVQLLDGAAEAPHWSPDGTLVAVLTCADPPICDTAAEIVNPDTGATRVLRMPDPALFTACPHWSPDAQRLACEGNGQTDPSRNGVYTISSAGGDLVRVTSNPGGDDSPGDFSPDRKRIAFVRTDPTGEVGIFSVRVNGSGLRQLTPVGMLVDQGFGGSWSPSGNSILFVARTDPNHRRAIWIVNSDGSGLHQLPIAPSCGGLFSDPKSVSCFDPGWSPDGSKIVFARLTADGTQSNIYTVNADGSGLFRVTNTGGNSQPDWGRHP